MRKLVKLTDFLRRRINRVENMPRTNHRPNHRHLSLRLIATAIQSASIYRLRLIVVDVQRRVIQLSVARNKRRWVAKMSGEWSVQAVRAIEIEALCGVGLSSTFAQDASIIGCTKVGYARNWRLLWVADVLWTFAWTTEERRREIA